MAIITVKAKTEGSNLETATQQLWLIWSLMDLSEQLHNFPSLTSGCALQSHLHWYCWTKSIRWIRHLFLPLSLQRATSIYHRRHAYVQRSAVTKAQQKHCFPWITRTKSHIFLWITALRLRTQAKPTSNELQPSKTSGKQALEPRLWHMQIRWSLI